MIEQLIAAIVAIYVEHIVSTEHLQHVELYVAVDDPFFGDPYLCISWGVDGLSVDDGLVGVVLTPIGAMLPCIRCSVVWPVEGFVGHDCSTARMLAAS